MMDGEVINKVSGVRRLWLNSGKTEAIHRSLLAFTLTFMGSWPLTALPSYGDAAHDLNYREGCMLLKHYQYRRAVAEFTTALKRTPDDPDILLARADALLTLEKTQEALEDTERAIKKDPKKAEAYFRRAQIELELSQLDRALADSNKAVQLDPKAAGYLVMRADLRRTLGNDKDALGDYNKILTLNPALYGVNYHRADIYLRLGRYKQAIADYTICINAKQKKVERALDGRAKCYEKIGRPDLAKKDRAEALNITRSTFGDEGDLLPK